MYLCTMYILMAIDNVLYEFHLVTIAGLTLTRIYIIYIYIIYTAHFVTYFTFIVNNTRYVSRIRKSLFCESILPNTHDFYCCFLLSSGLLPG